MLSAGPGASTICFQAKVCNLGIEFIKQNIAGFEVIMNDTPDDFHQTKGGSSTAYPTEFAGERSAIASARRFFF
jgi:hypothetical protein